MSETPRRLFQFTLGTLFMAITAMGCILAVTRVLGFIAGLGILLLAIGYWLIEVDRFPTPGIHLFGWTLVQAGAIALTAGIIASD